MALAKKKTTKSRTRKATPKPPPRPRLAMHAPPLHQSEEWATFGGKLVTAAADNTTMFVNPPNIPPLMTALGVLGPAITVAQGGTDAAQTAVVTATVKVHDLVQAHAAWILAGSRALAPADAVTFITTAGFQVVQPTQRPTRNAPELTNGVPGTVHFELPKVVGVVMWFIETSTDGGKTFVPAVDTERRSGDLTGLTSGTLVTVRLRAFARGTGYTPWTTLSIIVT